MLANCIAVVNSKGGVGKTSIVANLAGTAAAGGWRTLAVDLDPQGNLARDLGYWHDSDDGRGLAHALAEGQPAVPRCSIRPGLDVLAGGRALTQLGDSGGEMSPGVGTRLQSALLPLHDHYDLVVLDCPPASGPLQQAALAVAGFALIPTKADDASIDGLEGLAQHLSTVRETVNPGLRVLGIVLFDLGAGDKRLRTDARRELEALLDGLAPVLTAVIRHSRRAARDMRRDGKLASEYEHAARTGPRWVDDHKAPSFSTAATGLANDYQQLTDDVLAAMTSDHAMQDAPA